MAPLNSVRIRLRYPDLDTFVEKFAPNVTRGGIFLASRNVQPVGSVISFEVQLLSGEVALAGQGKVTWTKDFNPAEPSRPYGMGVQFTSVEAATRPTLARVLRARETGGIMPRRTTDPLRTLGDAAGRATPGFGVAFANGRSAVRVDTTVDLAAEYGLDDTAVRRVIDRTWVSLSGARALDELADLLKPEPVENLTLAQALADLPRLLDPERSRRRTTGNHRTGDSGPLPVPARDAAEITQQTDPSVVDSVASASAGSSGGAGNARSEAAEDTDMTGAAAALHEEAAETTNMAVEAAAGGGGGHAGHGGHGGHGGGRPRRKRRR